MTSSLKKLLADCFKNFADVPKTGLLAARAIYTERREENLWGNTSLFLYVPFSLQLGLP